LLSSPFAIIIQIERYIDFKVIGSLNFRRFYKKGGMTKIIGVIWVVLGTLWLAKPEILKNRLKRKITHRMKLTIYGFLLVFGILIIGSVIKAEGLLSKVAGVLGAIDLSP
jgi:hypothetical protein